MKFHCIAIIFSVVIATTLSVQNRQKTKDEILQLEEELIEDLENEIEKLIRDDHDSFTRNLRVILNDVGTLYENTKETDNKDFLQELYKSYLGWKSHFKREMTHIKEAIDSLHDVGRKAEHMIRNMEKDMEMIKERKPTLIPELQMLQASRDTLKVMNDCLQNLTEVPAIRYWTDVIKESYEPAISKKIGEIEKKLFG